MQKKQILFKTKGMNRDLSVSAFNPEFSFENRNLRLSTNENNTLLSWVNEKGTSLLNIETIRSYDDSLLIGALLSGVPIGTAVFNSRIVLFTHDNISNLDYIYVLEYSDDDKTSMSAKMLFSGYLNFNLDYPLETLIRYEDDSIQKVYWTDGYNQPRMINIAAPVSTMKKWNTPNEDHSKSTCFDFVATINSWGEMSVEKSTAGGTFEPGVIQYAYTYMNNYGQQSNIIQVSPLYYIASSDRGGKQDEKITNSFKIVLNNLDLNFDCVRLYSIQRTSLNGDVKVREVDTLPIIATSYTVQDIDNIVDKDGEYTDIVLPYIQQGSSWERIITIGFRNGTYHNTIVSADSYIPSGFVGTSDVIFTDLAFESAPFTFEEFVSRFKNKFVKTKFLTYIKFTSDLANDIMHLKGWNSLYFQALGKTNIQYALYDKYFVYDYETQLWYLAMSIPTTDTTTNEQVVSESIVVVDNGTTGASVDPYELLFIGGKEITALTMTEKDNTLFMGNIEEKNYSVSNIQKYFNTIRGTEDKINIQFTNKDLEKQITLDIPTSHYGYNSMLGKSMKEFTTFKGNETYRFGFQLQRHTGEWSEPVFLSDEKNILYPSIGGVEEDSVNLVCAKATISMNQLREAIGDDLEANFGRIRPVIVYPTVNDRSVLCQGVLNPTVFNVEDRESNTPFSQASWFFRPYLQSTEIHPPHEGYDYSIQPYVTIDPDKGQGDCVDTNFDAEDRARVCVMLVQVTDGTRYLVREPMSILGTLTTYYSNNASPYSITRTFNIITTIEISRNLFVLVSNTEWETVGVRPPSSSSSSISKEVFKYNNFNDNQIKGYFNFTSVYKELVKERSFPLYYVRPSSEKKEYARLMFYINDTHYTVYYPCINSSSVVYDVTKGNNVIFKHYDTLPEDKSGAFNYQTEIQGSKNKYGSITGGTVRTNANTQFFVDQSIVTLNSPDIEFDSDVQSFTGEGLALRIVGIVPITGSASYHRIDATGSAAYGFVYGKREAANNLLNGNLNLKASNRLVADKIWNDTTVKTDEDGNYIGWKTADFPIFPWHKSGSLNNDWRPEDSAVSVLRAKKESSILYSYKSEYGTSQPDFLNTDVKMCLWENSHVHNVRLKKQREKDADINYYPNIDKVLVNPDGYNLHFNVEDITNDKLYYQPVSMKYKSGSHAVIALRAAQGNSIPILPKAWHGNNDYIGEVSTEAHDVFWKTGITIKNSQSTIDIKNYAFKDFNFLLLGELYRPDTEINNRFGGDTDTAIKSNKWQVAGDTVDLIGEHSNPADPESDLVLKLKWTYGDTYYQRYDCLKTYPFTNEDKNQLVEILSFMCETHVNIDGRYDSNRGQVDNTVMSPTIFNLMNDAYSQQDNYFTYRISNTDTQIDSKYPNMVVWSKSKESGSNVDIWTNVTMASSLEFDGDKGEIKKLTRLNDQLLCFQDESISQILYNENVQISSTAGVPIEIANSGKVRGKRYLSNTVGCGNKWSVVNTPAGIYFMDSNEKSIYLFNGQLQNISTQGGMNSWCKNQEDFNSFVAYYDRQNQDVLFINDEEALAFSEKLGNFTSFYDYGGASYLCNLDDTGVWLKKGLYKIDNIHRGFRTTCWKHQAGEYGVFFDEPKPYSMTLIGNPEPQLDKIFTNLEFRACSDMGNADDNQLPFDYLETWNEYQHGFANLSQSNGRGAYRHHNPNGDANLAKKFRIWRCDIPRDNAEYKTYPERLDGESDTGYSYRVDAYNKWLDEEHAKNIYRYGCHPNDRMRNPWIYLKLVRKEKQSSAFNRTEIHDVMMTYFE